MQTPADTDHWRGKHIQKGEEAKAAEDFAEACYRERLDVIGITDHNFLGIDFIPHLKDAFSEIKKNTDMRLHFFQALNLKQQALAKECMFYVYSSQTVILELLIAY